MRRLRLIFLAALSGLGASALYACNDIGDCPATAEVKPDAACSSDQLQCAYNLTTPDPTCMGGPTTVINSSCTCTSGAWACPAPVVCPGAADASPPGDGAVDAGTPDTGSGPGDGRTGS